jgi:hypothetical protein
MFSSCDPLLFMLIPFIHDSNDLFILFILHTFLLMAVFHRAFFQCDPTSLVFVLLFIV